MRTRTLTVAQRSRLAALEELFQLAYSRRDAIKDGHVHGYWKRVSIDTPMGNVSMYRQLYIRTKQLEYIDILVDGGKWVSIKKISELTKYLKDERQPGSDLR